jgi:hypothetical protein
MRLRIGGECGAAGSRTLVRRWNGHAFYMFSDTLIFGTDQAVSLAKSILILLRAVGA